jgi:hypothetical protein
LPFRRNKHKRFGANLRAVGLLPKGYHLGSLTKNQKDRIIKLVHKYPGPAHRPQDFVTKTVTSATAKKLRAGGYRVKQKKALFEKFGAQKVSLRGGAVERDYTDLKRTTIATRGDIFEQARRFFKRKKPGQYLTLRIGDKSHFGRRIYSMGDFNAYMDWMKRNHPNFESFQNYLEIVEVKPHALKRAA